VPSALALVTLPMFVVKSSVLITRLSTEHNVVLWDVAKIKLWEFRLVMITRIVGISIRFALEVKVFGDFNS
jgi:hypothetical protein